LGGIGRMSIDTNLFGIVGCNRGTPDQDYKIIAHGRINQ
jgi:hypothetical protein